VSGQSGQLKIDFEWDHRAEALAREFALMLAPHVDAGPSCERIKELAGRMAVLASKRLLAREDLGEVPCALCGAVTKPDERARIVACVACATSKPEPGSRG
jgi:hypothetical protein